MIGAEKRKLVAILFAYNELDRGLIDLDPLWASESIRERQVLGGWNESNAH